MNVSLKYLKPGAMCKPREL